MPSKEMKQLIAIAKVYVDNENETFKDTVY